MTERLSDDRLRKVAGEGYALNQDRISEMASELLALRAAGPAMPKMPSDGAIACTSACLRFLDGDSSIEASKYVLHFIRDALAKEQEHA